MPLDYHRPGNLAEAIALIRHALPLGGGTSLTPKRREVSSVVDLQDLDLHQVRRHDDLLELGASVRLQTLLEDESVPAALQDAAHREAGWNLRNAATLGGTVAAADSRSPLLLVLLTLGTEVRIGPDEEWTSLETLLAGRPDSLTHKLILALRLRIPSQSAYEQVGRTPADWPLVSASASLRGGEVCVGLGGFGARPILLPGAKTAAAYGRAAAEAFSAAGDAWASAAYRSDVAAVLAARVADRVGIR